MSNYLKIKPEKRELITAVTHIDSTRRLQTLHKDITPLFYKLIEKFRQRTGISLLLNTSFNENEPIVNTPLEALDCYFRMDMDALIMGKILVIR
jgi:carbamoyltransferase